jgi:hypothetical protein
VLTISPSSGATTKTRFGYRSTLAGVNDEFIATGDPGNQGLAVGTAYLFAVEGEITTSGLAVAILCFGSRSTLAGVDDASIESGDPENLAIAVGIACQSAI